MIAIESVIAAAKTVLEDAGGLARLFAEVAPADIVEVTNALSIDEATAVLQALPVAKVIDVFDQSNMHHRSAILRHLNLKLAVQILESMSADQRSTVIREMTALERRQLLPKLSAHFRTEADLILRYPAQTAGSIMTSEFVRLNPDITVQEALMQIRKVAREKETIYACYVLQEGTDHLLGAISLRDLVIADPSNKVAQVMRKKTATAHAYDDQEVVAGLIAKYNLLAVPVLESDGRVVGFVTVDDVIDVMVREQTEDVLKMGAVEPAVDERPYMRTPLLSMVRQRAGWLVILFLGEMLTATAMAYFEDEIAKAVVLALFVPLIISSGGNSGAQATTLIIRALALNEIKLRDWWQVLCRELTSGLMLGAILGTIGFLRIAIWSQFTTMYGPHWVLIGTVVGLSLVGVVLWGTLSGSMLPFLLKRCGLDPATSSAPFVATLVDVTGLIIYFSVAFVILHGTVL